MIRFLFKGILRDKQRSLLPVVVVTIGVMLTVFLYCWLKGILNDSIELNARFSTGHVKIMTAPYARNIDQIPNDLALTGVDSLILKLKKEFPEMKWEQRIHFGGLIDVPDSIGETRSQGPAIGFGIDMLSGDNSEIERFNLVKSMRRGRLPAHSGEILMSEEFSRKLKINPGDTVTLIGSTMNGSMAMYNYTVCGTTVFGTGPMDHGSVIVDIEDVRNALDMNNTAGEIVGYLPDNYYDEEKANQVVTRFSILFPASKDEYAPVITTLRQQNNLGVIIDGINKVGGLMVFVFVLSMSLVLWNAGLLGGLRRYTEFGTRLAIGEDYSHIYKTMIYESVLIGILGSVCGSIIGLLGSLYLQQHGIDIGSMMKNSTMMMPAIFRTRITPVAFFIGFIPGLLSTVIGTMLSGIGIYKRKTAYLFKELEA
ncbi:MAG: FtsX-like permease family protein [Bacteroidia bacterium]|nr:FtsX-like permease family protein [Bacteroidia bacterium]